MVKLVLFDELLGVIPSPCYKKVAQLCQNSYGLLNSICIQNAFIKKADNIVLRIVLHLHYSRVRYTSVW